MGLLKEGAGKMRRNRLHCKARWWRESGVGTALVVCVAAVAVAAVALLAPTVEAVHGVCAENTFPALNTRGQHFHCICPDEFICEGCSHGCQPAMKNRCVNGFIPSCTTCRCSKETGDEEPRRKRKKRPRLGDLVDRIDAPFCEAEGEAFPASRKYDGNGTFVFVVSNGHTGTTFLGQLSTWRTVFGRVPRGYVIVHEQEADKALVQQLPFHDDWCQRALEYVADHKVPFMQRALDNLGAHTYFAAGHQIILGMLPALADILGDRVRFVRLRRNRFDTAYSYMPKRGGPCQQQCHYCLCPLDRAARCPAPSGDVWNSLNSFQQYLWSVDEVECQWQALLQSRPHLQHMEINWSGTIEPSTMQTLASFLGMTFAEDVQVAQTVQSNEHVSRKKRGEKNMTLLHEWARDYEQRLRLPHCNDYTCIVDAADTQQHGT
ncbi:hypothetical protein PTSG_08392 [Salpingoeca rosetta]|uniref:Sulfotransferase domain-containing protein n=1 Tax=Salpingoeca rosetta (strain ATCC 50818 / BSB-021) TaxID=946362 RepID=F2UJJ9_SALR5|nr:uncharacterized protein PTSG_08392 [Salpingoeca rosetta]EGD77298.1 hypothetical protein PTSG_08392 [Salpingoeca rosetta]|eukprot:XP_004990642.1 hypothetical protein PTSG_08392 [Salpingoeca rosetta]